MKVSWQDVERIVQKIAKEVEGVDSIYGIKRGGLVPAVMLSHKLNLPLIEEPTLDTLIVDEISDSGNTLHYFHQQTATLYVRHSSISIPRYYGEMIESDEWLIFPWEAD